ncbi:MAG: proline dehydrogenase family protein [Nitrospirota bacterium]|nr:proline dehydrogenase family protein [Nitrospirota bacterium]
MDDSRQACLAGNTMEEALEKARHLNKEGLGTLLAPHWHYSDNPDDSLRILEETDRLITQMGHRLIRGGLSLDPRSFGLDGGWKEAMDRLVPLVTKAEEYGYGVWLDIEETDSIGAGIDLYLALRPRFPHLAITLSARLSRSLADLEAILQVRGRVRLVKGLPMQDDLPALSEEEVSKRYCLLMEILFQESNFFALATHDPELIRKAEELMKDHAKMFEFQMYVGIADLSARKLVYEGGHPTTLYLPFGEGTSRHLDRLVAGGRLPSGESGKVR